MADECAQGIEQETHASAARGARGTLSQDEGAKASVADRTGRVMGQRDQQSRTSRRAGAGSWLVAAAAAALCALLPAGAQAKLGEGFKMGPGRLKLGVELEGRYDSMAGVGVFGANSGSTTLDARANPNPGDGIGRLRGAFLLDVPGKTVRVNFAGALDWNQYLGLVVNTTPASYFGANATGAVQINPEGAGGLDLTESFLRSDQLTNPILGTGVLGLSNATKLRGRLRPGGGAVETGLSYEFGGEFFQPMIPSASGATGLPACGPTTVCQPEYAPGYNSLTHRFGLDAKWRFLPKTGITLEATYALRDYYQDGAAWKVQNTNAQPLRVLLGFGTLLNTRLTFALRGGYTAIFFDQNKPTYQDWIGQAEVGFRLTETLQTRAGYLRTYEPVATTLLAYGSNRAYWDFRAQFSRLVLTAQAGLDFIGYLGDPSRQDTIFSAGLHGDYNLSDWLRLTGGFDAFKRDSTGLGSQQSNVALNYSRWVASVGVATLF